MSTSKKIEIVLDGPQGNAYYMLGLTQELAAKGGMDGKKIVAEMKSGDYRHLIDTFKKNFGKLVTLKGRA